MKSIREILPKGKEAAFASGVLWAAQMAVGIKTSCKPPPAYRSHPWEETDGTAL